MAIGTNQEFGKTGIPVPFQVLKTLAEISVVIGAGLYVTGWSYLYGYYRGFGLPASDIPSQSALVYSLPVLQSTQFLLGSVSVFLFSIYLIPRMRNFSSWGYLLVIFITLFLVPRHASKIGRANANRDAFVSTSTLPFVNFEGSGEEEFNGCALSGSNYRLLIRANGQIYVVLPVENTDKASNLRVCSFPESRVLATRIQVGLKGTQQ
jgi:hypothetical protein